MAAGDTVVTTFGADDSPFQAVAARVRNAIMGIAGFKGNPAAIASLGANMGGLQRGAAGAAGSIALLTSAFRGLMPAIAAVTGVGSAFAAVVASFKKATDIEQTVFQLQNLGGGAEQTAGALQKINDTAQETATPFAEIGQKAKTLIEAGLSADEAADATERLQKIAVMTGESFEDLADIYAKVQLKQEVTIRDLNKLKAIPGIAEIVEQFRTLEKETSAADRAAEQNAEHMRYQYEQQSENMRYTYEQTEKQINATTELAGKLGLAQQLFNQWKSGGRMTADSSFGGLSNQTIAQLETGIKQLQKESGLYEDQLREFAQQGKLGYGDLISAAGRYREEQQKTAELEMQQKQKAQEQQATEERYARQNKLLAEQRNLIGEIGEAIKRVTDPGGMFSDVTKLFGTFGGKLKEMMYDIQNAFANFGMPLLDAMKPVLDLINGQMMPALNQLAKNFGEWMAGEIKTIYDALSGDEAAAESLKEQFGNALRTVFETASEFLFEQMQRVAIAFRDIFVNMFTTGSMEQILNGIIGVFVNASEVVGKVFARGIVNALAEAFKNVSFLGINDQLKKAADSINEATSPDKLKESINVALRAFDNVKAGIEGLGTGIIEDWGKEVKSLFPSAKPGAGWTGFEVGPEMGGTESPVKKLGEDSGWTAGTVLGLGKDAVKTSEAFKQAQQNLRSSTGGGGGGTGAGGAGASTGEEDGEMYPGYAKASAKALAEGRATGLTPYEFRAGTWNPGGFDPATGKPIQGKWEGINAKRWIPDSVDAAGKWIQGKWEGVKSKRWVPGQTDESGKWTPGRWEGVESPAAGQPAVQKPEGGDAGKGNVLARDSSVQALLKEMTSLNGNLKSIFSTGS